MNFRHQLLILACASLGFVACNGGTVSGAPESPTAAPATEPAGDTVPGTEIGTPPELGEPTVFGATMTGRETVPSVYDTRATGTANFALEADGATLRYEVTHTLAAPTEAHLHLGIAGESGEVLVELPVAPGVIAGSVTLTAAQALAVTEGRAYVDVHSADYPDGEIRGQVVRPGEVVYVATLSADQVNPPSESASRGVGEFLVDGVTNRMRYIVHVEGMAGVPTMAVIGLAPAGADGPMAVDLADPKTLPGARFDGVRTVASTEDLDLGRWYLNVHSRRFPQGELRGQILRPGQELYVGHLSGDEAVPPVSTSASGSVAVIVDRDRDRIIYDVALSNLTPTAAHLAEGPRGTVGAPTMPFQVLGNRFRSMRMLTPDSTLLASLGAGNVYATAASAMFPEGEIRGQMRRVALPR